MNCEKPVLIRKQRLLIGACVAFILHLPPERLLFADNFEEQRLSSSWQMISGGWQIRDVSELRIAPAEDGYRSVLMAQIEPKEQHQIRLTIPLHDTLQGRKLQFTFAYYIKSSASEIRISGEYNRTGIKDGLRGKPWSLRLRRLAGRWGYHKQLLTVPPGANVLQIVFSGPTPSLRKNEFVCFDNVMLVQRS
jgi:hypothetical protein